jgi:hypothetical protein
VPSPLNPADIFSRPYLIGEPSLQVHTPFYTLTHPSLTYSAPVRALWHRDVVFLPDLFPHVSEQFTVLWLRRVWS